MLNISKRIVLYVCLCLSVTLQAIDFHIPSYKATRYIGERAHVLRTSLTKSLSKVAQCKALTYIQTHPKKIGVYTLATTAALSVCVCGLRAIKRHSSEGTRVSLMQRVRNFVGRLGSFMHRGQRQQAQETVVSAQQLAQMREELGQLQNAHRALEGQHATLAREKDNLERQNIELAQVQQGQSAYALLFKTIQDASKGVAEDSKLISELQSELSDCGRRVERVDAESADLRNKAAAYERSAALLEARCTQLQLKQDRLQRRIVTADVTTQTEDFNASGLVGSGTCAAPSKMPPAPPSIIDFGADRRSVAESLFAVAGEGRAEVTDVLEQSRRLLEQAQQRNKVDVTRASGFAQVVNAALVTSYNPVQQIPH